MNITRGIGHSLVAGFAGTTAMATSTFLQGVLGGRSRPIDYDDSRVAIDLVERWTPLELSGRSEGVANQLLRFGYGSLAGGFRHLLDGRIRHPAVALFALTWGGEAALLRGLGLAPPPWRWPRRLLLASAVHHAIYVAATDVTYRWTPRDEEPSLGIVDPDRRQR